MTSIEIPNTIVARRVIQNNQEFLSGTFEIRQVRNFTRFTQHLIVGFEEVPEDGKIYKNQTQYKPRYNPQIQRKTNNSKVEGIADYLLSDPNAMFPTNIVIAIPSEVIDSLEEKDDKVKITLNEVVKEELAKENGDVFLTIIDGQHRIRGIERAIERLNLEIATTTKVLSDEEEGSQEIKEKLKKSRKLLKRLMDFQLIVTFFVDPTLEYQAMIFATINKTQTKVPENLVYSLFGITKNDSPQKTSLEVVLALNGLEKSPFYNRIRLVGNTFKSSEPSPLSQATMVKSVLFGISNNLREAETDRFKDRSELKKNPKNLPFRKYYANNKDAMIVRILYTFFSAVRVTFRDNKENSYWDFNDEKTISNVLHTNVGFQALLKVLIDILKVAPEDKKDSRSFYEGYLIQAKKIDWEDSGEEKRYPFTSSTINTLYEDIMRKIKLT
jgi:DGQHR domain-containing protein